MDGEQGSAFLHLMHGIYVLITMSGDPIGCLFSVADSHSSKEKCDDCLILSIQMPLDFCTALKKLQTMGLCFQQLKALSGMRLTCGYVAQQRYKEAPGFDSFLAPTISTLKHLLGSLEQYRSKAQKVSRLESILCPSCLLLSYSSSCECRLSQKKLQKRH